MLAVVLGFLVFVEQTDFCLRQFVQNLTGKPCSFARLVLADMRHLPVRRIGNDFPIVLEKINPQKPVVVRGVIFNSNAKPLMIGVERIRHDDRLFPNELIVL